MTNPHGASPLSRSEQSVRELRVPIRVVGTAPVSHAHREGTE